MAQTAKKLKSDEEDTTSIPPLPPVFAASTAAAATATPRHHVLIGCTGSVASIRIPQLVQELVQHKQLQVSVVATDNACHFFNSSDFPEEVTMYKDADEWETWKKWNDPVLHIELRRQADLLVIAPLDANTLAKIANGICDNLLTCVVRAWDLSKPLLFCTAMNTHMWHHPITARQINTLKDLGYIEVPCVEKKLACGDVGQGGMAAVSTITQAVLEALER